MGGIGSNSDDMSDYRGFTEGWQRPRRSTSGFWEERLGEAGEAVAERRVGWRARVLG